ncbi:hypothetical protein F5B20DRAFT_561599 [Whalleya microplaca]|nr:hypothetical protein F5B20DRAFT_561599 [Whalleya microplaca]
MNAQSPISIADDESRGIDEPRLKDEIFKSLDNIQTTGDVAIAERHGIYANPGLSIGDTLIPLPLVPRDAETIRSACRRAPFGRGEETLVDTSVRKTWELDHSQFKLTNPNWPRFLDMLLKDVQQKLGMSTIRAESL